MAFFRPLLLVVLFVTIAGISTAKLVSHIEPKGDSVVTLARALLREPVCREAGFLCLLDALYADDEPKLSSNVDMLIEKSLYSSKAMTYGEITPLGLHQVLAHPTVLQGVPPSREDVFVDLGSGSGKMVLQSVLAEGFGRGVGVELAGHRHATGVAALRALEGRMGGSGVTEEGTKASVSLGAQVVELLNEDVLTFDITGTTIMVANLLCFPTFLFKQVQDKLSAELLPGTVIVSSRRLSIPHRDIVLLSKPTGLVSWTSARFDFRVYVKVPNFGISLPSVFAMEEPDDAARDAARQSWAKQAIKSLEVEFVRLGGRQASGSSADAVVEEDFVDGVSSEWALPAVLGRRLVRAFGAARSDVELDPCGCLESVTPLTSERPSWSISFGEFLAMATRGVFNRTSDIFSVANLLLPELHAIGLAFVLKAEKGFRFEAAPGRKSLGDVDVPGRTCFRTWDGRTAYNVALEDSQDALSALSAMAPGMLFCRTTTGGTLLHNVFRLASSKDGEVVRGLLTVVHRHISAHPSTRFALARSADWWGRTPLSYASDAETVRTLVGDDPVSQGMEWGVFAPDFSGQTPLERACKKGKIELAEALASLDVLSWDGNVCEQPWAGSGFEPPRPATQLSEQEGGSEL